MDDDDPRTFHPFYQSLTEDECQQLAAGKVPEWLASACRTLVEWRLETGPVDFVGMRLRQMRNEAARASTSARRVRPGGTLDKRTSTRAAPRASTRRGRGSRKTARKTRKKR